APTAPPPSILRPRSCPTRALPAARQANRRCVRPSIRHRGGQPPHRDLFHHTLHCLAAHIFRPKVMLIFFPGHRARRPISTTFDRPARQLQPPSGPSKVPQRGQGGCRERRSNAPRSSSFISGLSFATASSAASKHPTRTRTSSPIPASP